MALTEEQRKARVGKLSASQIGILIRGDESQLLDLWRCVSGDPNYVEPDFSDNWAVQLGVASEDLNLKWFEKKYGPVSRKGESVTHANGWAACTLDGWSDEHECPIEAKHVIQYKKLPEVLDWYSPQLHWQMYVTGTKRNAASVIIGSLEPEVTFIPCDEVYLGAILKRADEFMKCVDNMIPPVKMPEILPPVRPEDYITIDGTGDNRLGEAAAEWLLHKDSADKFEASKKAIKDIMPPNCGLLFGYNIYAKRAKNGAVTIKEGNPP